MHARKQEAYRALELLEQYYSRLNSPEDAPLRDAIGRVIKVFKSRLFQALIDIQEFYESILMDEHSDRIAKMNATHRFADNWETTPMVGKTDKKDEPTVLPTLITTNPTITTPATTESKGRKPTPTPFSQLAQPSTTTTTTTTTTHEPSPPARPSASTGLISQNDFSQFSYADHWKEYQIHLDRSSGGGLGFSIAGGKDTPCINGSPAVVVTKISEGGLAAQSGEMKLHDIILSVNDEDFTNIDHQPAVDFLKSAGPHVHLIVRRLAPKSIEEIPLTKTRDSHLGFSIGGGITHEHVKGDYGIFITNIIPGGIADKDGRLKIGDRLLSVQSERETYDLEFVEHKQAVEAIRQACEESPTIKLFVGHVTDPLALNSTSTTPATTVNGHLTNKDDESLGERHVKLRRGPNGFGLSIIGADEKIYISFITAGGPADKSGLLKRGDQILSVNEHDFRRISREEATNILKSCRDDANLIVINKLKEYLYYDAQQSENLKRLTRENTGSTTSVRAATRQPFYVRADFDYDPAKDMTFSGSKGLAFHQNDILHVLNAVDDNWWSAELVIDGKDDGNERGIIPSKSRVEKKERARQKRVNFNGDKGSRSNTVEREKKKKKKSFNPFNKSGDKRDIQSGEESEVEVDVELSEPVASYTLINKIEINYVRPVVILGPFKDQINDQLLNDLPEKFVNCVPHTSRPKRDNEVEGRDYYFASSREQMELDIRNLLFIEAGEYNKHLYGTSIEAVRRVIQLNKHCVLDVSSFAVQRLLNANICPIVILIKARDLQWILENMGNDGNEIRAQQILDKANQVEVQLNDLFTAMIEEANLDETYQRILEVIETEQEKPFVWIPSKENIN